MNEYLDSGEYFVQIVCALNAAWLNASQRSQCGVHLNRSARD